MMSVFPYGTHSILHHHHHHHLLPLPLSASAHAGVEFVKEAHPAVPSFKGTKERIQKLFSKVDLSVSSYDTAWVAMIPSPSFPKVPCFPECLNWLMDNQFCDGSWGLPHHHPLLLKDTLSSTLACILALKRWSVGEDHINKGLQFIESNFASASHRSLHSPIGFDIIFPHMLEYAKDLNLKLPLEQADLNMILHKRELELRRCQSQKKDAYLAYVSEGLGKFFDWKMVMKYQMKNGSLFNSPSATAAAFIHHQDAGCLNYLSSVLEKFGNAVPTVYPLDLYVQLCMVNNLERLGIARHFMVEIQNVLDETYRCWVQGDEQIFMDVVACALAFRVLRANGYDVSSDPLAEISNKTLHKNSLGEPFEDVYAALEVYRASHIVYQDELAFREQISNLRDFLKQTLVCTSIPTDRQTKFLHLEVDDALKFPFNSSLERMSSRKNIEHYNVDNTRVLKSSYCSSNISNKDYLRLAVEDFNTCQSIFRGEVEYLERWVVEKGLDKLKFARQKTAYCYFSAASTLSSPELSDARISWAKSGILTTVIDDFFDVGGTMEELMNLIQLVEKWNVNADSDCCSEDVRIIFLALKDAICWIGNRAFKWQSRSVTSHVIETWLSLMNSMLKEAVWRRDNRVPTLNEYMENGYVSFALGPIVLPALYLVGPKLSVKMVQSSEYHKLFELMSTYGRLKNDIQGFKRELKEGKMNAVTLHMSDGNSTGGAEEEEEVVEEIKTLIEKQKRQLLRLVLQEKGSVVPRACKDLFWNMCSVLNLFYATNDGFTENGILDVVKAIIYEPVSVQVDVSL